MTAESFASLTDALTAIKEHELKENVRYVVMKTHKGFGQNDMPTDRRFKVQWDSEGHPFIVLACKRYGCHYGVDKNIKKKMERAKKEEELGSQYERDFNNPANQNNRMSKKRKALPNDHENYASSVRCFSTKKMGCPAFICVKEIFVYPDIQATTTRMQQKVRWRFKSKTERTEKRFLVYFPDISVHAFHPIGTPEAGHYQRLDQIVIDKIYELTKAGFTSPTQIHAYLGDFVRATVENVDEGNRRFFPTIQVVRHHMKPFLKNLIPPNDDGTLPSSADLPAIGHNQRLDKIVVDKIYELTAAGLNNAGEIQRHLEEFVRATVENVDEENRRFFPTKTGIRYHMRFFRKNHMKLADDEVEKQVLQIMEGGNDFSPDPPSDDDDTPFVEHDRSQKTHQPASLAENKHSAVKRRRLANNRYHARSTLISTGTKTNVRQEKEVKVKISEKVVANSTFRKMLEDSAAYLYKNHIFLTINDELHTISPYKRGSESFLGEIGCRLKNTTTGSNNTESSGGSYNNSAEPCKSGVSVLNSVPNTLNAGLGESSRNEESVNSGIMIKNGHGDTELENNKKEISNSDDEEANNLHGLVEAADCSHVQKSVENVVETVHDRDVAVGLNVELKNCRSLDSDSMKTKLMNTPVNVELTNCRSVGSELMKTKLLNTPVLKQKTDIQPRNKPTSYTSHSLNEPVVNPCVDEENVKEVYYKLTSDDQLIRVFAHEAGFQEVGIIQSHTNCAGNQQIENNRSEGSQVGYQQMTNGRSQTSRSPRKKSVTVVKLVK